MSWRRAMAAATLVTLVRERWWLLALGSFLVRGGLLLLLPPLLVVPTPAEIGSLLSPSLVGTGVAHPTAALLTLLAVSTVTLLAVLLGTTVVGTWLDLALIDAQRTDEELEVLGAATTEAGVPVWAAMEVRITAHVPTAIALAVGLVVLGNALQAELLSAPAASPLALRVVLREPLASAAIVVAWLVGEAWGGLAIRRLAGTGSSLGALRRGLVDLVRPSGLATLLVTSVVIGAAIAGLWLAAGRAFDRVWPLVVEPSDGILLVVSLGLLAGTWAVGLWLLGIGLAWRSAAWTSEVLRRT